MSIQRSVLIVSATLAVAMGLVTGPARSVSMQSSITDGGVQLVVPGIYWEFTMERAAQPDGPFGTLASRYIGCTEACEYLDLTAEEGATYYYRSLLLAQDGRRIVTAIHRVDVPLTLGLTASPNPSSDRIMIGFRVPLKAARLGDVEFSVDIVDAAGRHVARAFTGLLGRGDQAIAWDGRDDRGALVAAGSYFYVVRAGRFVESGRITRTP